MIKVKAEDGEKSTMVWCELQGRGGAIMNEYRAITKAIGTAFIEKMSDDDKKLAKSEIIRMFAEVACLL